LNAILQGFHSLTQDVTTACVADATGIITVAITAPPAHAASIIDDLHAQLRAHGGMVVVLRPGSGMPDDIDRWGVSPSAIAVMRAVNISSIRSVCSTSENS